MEMCDKGNQTERDMSPTTPPIDHRPSYFRMDWTFVRHPQLALERDFWKSQLFKCKHVCLYPFERFDGADIPTVIDVYPQLPIGQNYRRANLYSGDFYQLEGICPIHDGICQST